MKKSTEVIYQFWNEVIIYRHAQMLTFMDETIRKYYLIFVGDDWICHEAQDVKKEDKLRRNLIILTNVKLDETITQFWSKMYWEYRNSQVTI